MATISPVVHSSARAIRLAEFLDALRATCKPRFPHARGSQHRPVVLAISGGVDSMALAYLCSKVRRFDPDFKISDNPVQKFQALVVDHGLREGSNQEAEAVCKALWQMEILSEVLPINWNKEIGLGTDPNLLPNLESVARRVRYRKLGTVCANRKVASLMLAHHQDDQYETVLMRLLNGHGSRGLRGMRRASGIPECEGVHGAYNSGWIDDQSRQIPYYNTKPTQRQRKYLRYDLRHSINMLLQEDEPAQAEDPWAGEENYGAYSYLNRDVSKSFVVGLLPIEDGGVNIYRPLLEFSKDRLVATCLENNVPWWEDHTNKDPTLTMRNAVRHLWKNFELPQALQKPAILELRERSECRAQALEAEANRLLQQTILHDFQPQVGTLVVQFPELKPPKSTKYRPTSERYQGWVSRKREVAGLLIQRILALVSPETQTAPLANLQNVISRLFPSLGNSAAELVATPKAFPIAGVHFMPIESTPQSVAMSTHPRTWYLARLPYPKNRPLPTWRTPYWSLTEQIAKHRKRVHWKWSTWLRWHFWDGRYWVRLAHRLPYRVVVMPFLIEHAKSFRESLLPRERKRLNEALKKYTPGKVRYTLPAIYCEEYLDLDNVVPRPNYPTPRDEAATDEEAKQNWRPIKALDTSKMRMLALPSLDIQVPELDKWLLYEMRYKRADRNTLQMAGTLARSPVRATRRVGRAVRSMKGRIRLTRTAGFRSRSSNR